jgi:hypothetical protein
VGEVREAKNKASKMLSSIINSGNNYQKI